MPVKKLFRHHYHSFFPSDKLVIVIGGGPSGIDLTHSISATATKVIFSHHTHEVHQAFPANVIKRGSIDRFTRHGVIFTDGSEETLTDIFFCTGNECNFRSIPSLLNISPSFVTLFFFSQMCRI